MRLIKTTNAWKEIAATNQPKVSRRTEPDEAETVFQRFDSTCACGRSSCGLLHRVELVPARVIDRADGADLHAHAALRAVLVERQVDLVQEDRVRRAGADAGSAVHAEHVVDRHDAVVAHGRTDGDHLLRHAGPATPRSARRTSSRSLLGSSVPCCTRRTG